MGRAGPPGDRTSFSPPKPLVKLFRRLFSERLQNAFDAGARRFFGDLVHLAEPASFHALAPHMRRAAWVVYAKKPFGGPAEVHVAFAWKDYRNGGAVKTMRLKPDEFIRRFLLHALPDGFHRIRHFGFPANGHRTEKLAICRSLVISQGEPIRQGKEERPAAAPAGGTNFAPPPCPECGGLMRAVADLPRGGRCFRSQDVAVLVRHVMSATTTIPSTPSLFASTQPSIGDRRTDLRSHGGAACIQRRHRALSKHGQQPHPSLRRQTLLVHPEGLSRRRRPKDHGFETRRVQYARNVAPRTSQEDRAMPSAIEASGGLFGCGATGKLDVLDHADLPAFLRLGA
jgi:hypothetical protein